MRGSLDAWSLGWRGRRFVAPRWRGSGGGLGWTCLLGYLVASCFELEVWKAECRCAGFDSCVGCRRARRLRCSLDQAVVVVVEGLGLASRSLMALAVALAAETNSIARSLAGESMAAAYRTLLLIIQPIVEWA